MSKKHSFDKCPFYKYEDFVKQFDEDKYSIVDLKYYYESAEGYSGANGGKYFNWIMAVKNWIRRDQQEGRLKIKKQERPQVQAKELSLPQQESVSQEYQDRIKEFFYLYKSTGVMNPLWVNQGVFNFWKKRGVIEGEQSEQDEENATKAIIKQKEINPFLKFTQGEQSGLIRSTMYRRLILEFYDKLIKDGEQIENYF